MDHHFELGNFAGPLDLLLYLVQKEEMDIREVSLVRICDQYLAHLKDLKSIDVDTAGEFLVMATTLMAIKARSLLPREEVDLARELDPEEELIQRLLEYRQLKEVTRILDRRSAGRDLIHQSRPQVTDAGVPLEELGLWHLVEAFRKVLADTGLDQQAGKTIVADRPLSDYIGDLLGALRASPRMAFHEVFKADTTRIDLIGHFLAVLELMRARLIRAIQETAFGEIVIEALREIPDQWEPAAELWTTKAPSEEELKSAPTSLAMHGEEDEEAQALAEARAEVERVATTPRAPKGTAAAPPPEPAAAPEHEPAAAPEPAALESDAPAEGAAPSEATDAAAPIADVEAAEDAPGR
ncbi:MAG: segregation/condensation protein A [Planctomycetes bacterium]|nr:segregation/condensation protein A [Planctomycetota bacterium]